MANIIEYTNKLIQYISEGNNTLKKGANKIMGGAVLETYADKKLKEGIREGIREGCTLMKKAIELIQEGYTSVDDLVARGIPEEVAKAALEEE